MLRCCEGCIDRQTLSYEDLIQVCGRCREAKKADMVDYAKKKDPFNGSRWDKGRQSLITKEQAIKMKELIEKGLTQKQVADIYGITQPTVSRVLKRKG